MKLTLLSAALSMAGGSLASSCSQVDGTYYCSEASVIKYESIGFSGSYDKISSMDDSSCSCSSSSYSFSGNLAPLDEELSVHFRGPINLKQFAVYQQSSSKSKRDVLLEGDVALEGFHGHHRHKREAEAVVTQVVEVTQTVYVNADGVTVTADAAETTSSVASTSSTYIPPSSSTEYYTSAEASSSAASAESSAASSTKSSSSAASSSTSSSSGSGWTRSAYYDASSGTSDGLVFLNTLGGTNGSGTWSTCFGNSLSYCNTDGTTGASESVVLDDVTVASDVEFIIFSDTSCETETGCGYYRDDIPAYHGFGGDTKMFVFEFQMPTDSSSSSSTTNYDMPAIWLLNAQIPRTLQYGDSSCSCWSSGCGELDAFEIVSSGSSKLISHIHDSQGATGSSGGAGSSDYFARPTSSTMKAAIIFNGDDQLIQIQVLDDDFEIASSLTSSAITELLSLTGTTANLVSS